MENKLYKIVKEYPFSPPVGTILHYDSFADWYQNSNEDYIIDPSYINKYPEFFEEVKEEYKFLVFTINRPFYNSFEVIELKKPTNTESYSAEKDYVRFFNTRAEAYDFIIDNKPCLCLDDLFQISHGNEDVLYIKYDKLKGLVQEKL